MKPISIVAVNAGLGAPSSSRMLADALTERLGDMLTAHNVGYNVQHLELREFATAIAHNFVTGFAEPQLQSALDDVRNADALIVVSPVFNGSYSGLFKSFFDLFDTAAMQGTPVVLAATGGSERHSLVLEYALRPLFTYLKASPVTTAVFAATSDWGADNDVANQLQARMTQAANELTAQIVQRTGGIGNGRGRELSPDPGEPIDVAGAQAEEAASEHSVFASLMQQFAATEVDQPRQA